ncbi:MAG: hypothetical protein PHR83_13650 [Paludibacter sp.]|nr:hypothetical protein [Paludibacter sp.]
MLSKIFFIAALILIVSWMLLFFIFDRFPYIHIIAILGIILFIASYTTNNAEE